MSNRPVTDRKMIVNFRRLGGGGSGVGLCGWLDNRLLSLAKDFQVASAL